MWQRKRQPDDSWCDRWRLCFVASDVPAILKYTRTVYYIGNLEMARMADGAITFYNLDGDEIEAIFDTDRVGCRGG